MQPDLAAPRLDVRRAMLLDNEREVRCARQVGVYRIVTGYGSVVGALRQIS